MKPPARGAPPPDVLARLRLICRESPEAHEEAAWAGIRWNTSSKTFAHALSFLKEGFRVLAPAKLAALVE